MYILHVDVSFKVHAGNIHTYCGIMFDSSLHTGSCRASLD